MIISSARPPGERLPFHLPESSPHAAAPRSSFLVFVEGWLDRWLAGVMGQGGSPAAAVEAMRLGL